MAGRPFCSLEASITGIRGQFFHVVAALLISGLFITLPNLLDHAGSLSKCILLLLHIAKSDQTSSN